jgi:hypothetical protein
MLAAVLVVWVVARLAAEILLAAVVVLVVILAAGEQVYRPDQEHLVLVAEAEAEDRLLQLLTAVLVVAVFVDLVKVNLAQVALAEQTRLVVVVVLAEMMGAIQPQHKAAVVGYMVAVVAVRETTLQRMQAMGVMALFALSGPAIPDSFQIYAPKIYKGST